MARILTFLIALSVAQSGQAQDFRLRVIVLMPPSPTSRVLAQEWAGVFQKTGHRVTFRQGEAGEKTTIENVELERGNEVKIIGLMNRQGAIDFRGKRFTQSQDKPLKEWLDNLQKFGADGPPRESRTWGLNDEQFKEVLQLLAEPVTEPVTWSTPLRSIESLKLPFEFRMTYSDEVRSRLLLKPKKIGDTFPDVKGFSKGTALAVVLAQYGLGFRPMASNDSKRQKYKLEVDVGDEGSNLYPVGWKNTRPITVALPALVKSVTVDVQELPVDNVVLQLSGHLKIPRVNSAFALNGKGRDTSVMRYTRRPDRISPSALMRVMGNTQKLGLVVRTDEIGRMFLWVTTKEEADAFSDRFRHITPGR